MPARVGGGRTNPDVPIPGRSWYRGAWRTPEEVERDRERQRSKRRAASGGVDRRKGPRKTDAEKEATRRARNERRARRLRERRLADPEWAERDRLRQRGRYVPRVRGARGGYYSDEQIAARQVERDRRAARRRMEQAEERRARKRARDEARARARASAKRAPAAVRTAWSRAKPNSIMRRKWPTMADLDASARRGEWDGWTP